MSTKIFDYPKIVDVKLNGSDVICEFEDGRVISAHCSDEDEFSFETGIMVCLGKYFLGHRGFNSMVRQGVKLFDDKQKRLINERLEELERRRIRENHREKHERYLKRRAEKLAAEKELARKRTGKSDCRNCPDRDECLNDDNRATGIIEITLNGKPVDIDEIISILDNLLGDDLR